LVFVLKEGAVSWRDSFGIVDRASLSGDECKSDSSGDLSHESFGG
jgi:hypothetical protein